MSFIKIFLIPIIFVVSIGFASVSFAGGGQGVVATFNAPVSEPGFFAKRHALGLEYALDRNSEFTRLLENEAIKAVLTINGVPSPVSSVVLAFKRQIERINYANQNGIDLKFVHSTITEAATIFLVSQGIDISPVKLATAFMVGYGYGFLKRK
ncbi:MAG: hypothetical protein HRU29_11945 [Rhizobiales bacterium]|nr:hypothetical protein [Hyphomicrobiales bacterium]NRB15101.1 hypothetical protein [Hyphomicrobiales bacterium]